MTNISPAFKNLSEGEEEVIHVRICKIIILQNDYLHCKHCKKKKKKEGCTNSHEKRGELLWKNS